MSRCGVPGQTNVLIIPVFYSHTLLTMSPRRVKALTSALTEHVYMFGVTGVYNVLTMSMV